MNREQLNKRIEEINREMAVTKAHHSKLEGHLSESIHWLAELDKKEAAPAPELPEVNPNDAVMD